MQTGQPSHTARGAAAHRALHQTLEGGGDLPRSLRRWHARRRNPAPRLDEMAADPAQRPMRLFIAARSRFSEERWRLVLRAACVRSWCSAPASTPFRCVTRTPGVGVFEVDYPATQGWKRERLTQAGLAMPSSLTFAPVDFERQSLADGPRRSRISGRSAGVFPVARCGACT